MCFPAMDNLQLGVFFGGGGKKKNSLTKGKKDRLITGWAMDYFFFMDLPFGGIFDCFNVVTLSPVNGGLLIKNTCHVIEIHIRD